MKIFKTAHPLPMNEIPIERGGTLIDQDLSPEIAKWLDSQYGLKELLGEGDMGVAFLTQDDKVLKLTTDASEAKAAKIRQTMPSYAPFAQIYSIENVQDISTSSNIKIPDSFFAIVKEKVTPLDENEKNEFMVASANTQDNDQDNEYIDYINEVSNYPFNDTFSPENVGRDQYGNLVAFDFRL